MSTAEGQGMGDSEGKAPLEEQELDDVAPADIDESAIELESFDKLVQHSRRLTDARVSAIVEALLLVSDKPVSVEQLHEATGIDRPRLQQGLAELGLGLSERLAGVRLVEVAHGWQLRTEPTTVDYVRRFLRVRPHRLTRAAVETLAIVAYRQPVTRPEIEDIRGVDSAAVLKALLDRRLLKILGKKEEVGRPILYGTTREFLEFFALKDLSALPTLHEFQELSEEHREILEHAPPPKATIADLSDPDFARKLEEATPSAEAALAELENAIARVDRQARTAATALQTAGPPSSPAGKDGD